MGAFLRDVSTMESTMASTIAVAMEGRVGQIQEENRPLYPEGQGSLRSQPEKKDSIHSRVWSPGLREAPGMEGRGKSEGAATVVRGCKEGKVMALETEVGLQVGLRRQCENHSLAGCKVGRAGRRTGREASLLLSCGSGEAPANHPTGNHT